MENMITLCDDIIDNTYLKTEDAKRIVDMLAKGLQKIEELRISRDKAITRRDLAEKKLKTLSTSSRNMEEKQ